MAALARFRRLYGTASWMTSKSNDRQENAIGLSTPGLVSLARAATVGAIAVLVLRVNPEPERVPQPLRGSRVSA